VLARPLKNLTEMLMARYVLCDPVNFLGIIWIALILSKAISLLSSQLGILHLPHGLKPFTIKVAH